MLDAEVHLHAALETAGVRHVLAFHSLQDEEGRLAHGLLHHSELGAHIHRLT